MSDNRIRKAFQNDFHIPDEIFWSDKQNIYISTKAREGAFQCAGIHNTALASYTKGFQAAETPLLARIAELEGQLAAANSLIILQRACIDSKGADITMLQLENNSMRKQLANREPFVVKLPLSISVLISDGLRADFMLNSEVKAAITAAGGRCV